MHDLKLGQLIEGEQHRDAIHIAVAPVKSKQHFRPGDHANANGTSISPIGIVDPFLKVAVQPGDTFWLFLYPNTITSLRHDWTHPAFESSTAAAQPVADKEASVTWLKDFADRIGLSYDAVVDAAKRYIAYGDYHTFHGVDTPGECYTERSEMWRHLEIAEGLRPSVDDRETTPFTCSC